MNLVTWNAQWCCGIDGVVSPKRIVEGARALMDFDVLCLQEIADGFPGLKGNAGANEEAEIARLLPGFEVFFGAAVDEYRDSRRARFGNLIATRLPVLHVQHHPLPWPADPGASSMPRMCTVVTVRDPALGPVRIMTTHLEYYSANQRLAQSRALLNLHREACALAASPPKPYHESSPFRAKAHTPLAVLCGDFNLDTEDPGYSTLTDAKGGPRLWDAWPLLHGEVPQPPTFRLYDTSHGDEPMACDFVFVSDGLKDRVRRFAIDDATQASDHQPLAVEIA